MTEIFGSIWWLLVTLGLLITFHEFGHFWVARRLGIRVLRFSIGFGKPLWRRRFGADDTEFVVAALPLGGYVKMLDEREAPVAEPEAARAFNRQPLWVRSAVILAGPMFNFLFAIAAYWLMFVSGVPGVRPVVGEVTPQSVAAAAGFREQDELLSVAGRQTPSWDAATLELLDAALARDSVEIRVREPDDRQRVLVIDFGAVSNALDKGGLLQNLGLAVWRPTVPAVIDRLVPGAPAEQAGLQPGDRIELAVGATGGSVAVDGFRVRSATPADSDGRTVPLALGALVLLLAAGLVGYGSGLFFLFTGAPDVAFTQFTVETVFVIVVASVLLALGAEGNVRTTTLRAYEWADAQGLIESR